jgi:hypothetical protein
MLGSLDLTLYDLHYLSTTLSSSTAQEANSSIKVTTGNLTKNAADAKLVGFPPKSNNLSTVLFFPSSQLQTNSTQFVAIHHFSQRKH